MYANYFEIGHNAFEFFLDFGQWFAAPEPAHLHTRIVATPSHAKGLFDLLGNALAEFERDHGQMKGEERR